MITDWLGEDNQLGIDIWEKKYRFDNETFNKWLDRVSGGNEDVKRLIAEKKFLFGGRTLANRNTGRNASYSNCYSSGYVPDSLSGIMDVAKNIALTYKSQGGQGLSLSKIRPKNTKINGQFESDGIIPFMEIFNKVTESVSQGGSRKGALMMSLACDHKEIKDFIHIKSKENKINKANLSVEIDDDFMNAVKQYYESGKVKELNFKKEYEGNTVEYSLKPIEIYKEIMQLAYDWAEPGVIFTNRFRNYNLMEYIDEYEIVTGNPCGEQPLPKHAACNLGSINLSEYVKNPFKEGTVFDINQFKKDVAIAVEALDDVLEEGKSLHPLKEQREMAINYRNIGLGVMGVGDMFFKLGVKYGSKESKKILDDIMYIMFRSAVFASYSLAKRKGTFPKYSEKIFDSQIIKNHFTKEEIDELKKHGVRNCSLLSIAPAGSIGTMLNVTTGIEPAFQLSYQRKTESLHKEKEVFYTVFVGSSKDYSKKYNTDKLPEYFITSSDINWQDRIDIQSIAQNHVDTAISSTINLPKEIDIEDVEKLYLYAWEKGLKGVTIYRSGCNREGILISNDNKNKIDSKNNIEWGTTIQASDDLIGKKRKIMSGCGSVHVQAWFDPYDGKLTEVYLSKGSTGGCNSWMISNSRTMSAALRTGMSFDYLIDQLKSSPACSSYVVRTATKGDTSKGNCCPASVANALVEMQKEVFDELGIEEESFIEQKSKNNSKNIKKEVKNKCPECGEELRFEGGCSQCNSCGYSRCE